MLLRRRRAILECSSNHQSSTGPSLFFHFSNKNSFIGIYFDNELLSNVLFMETLHHMIQSDFLDSKKKYSNTA